MSIMRLFNFGIYICKYIVFVYVGFLRFKDAT